MCACVGGESNETRKGNTKRGRGDPWEGKRVVKYMWHESRRYFLGLRELSRDRMEMVL